MLKNVSDKHKFYKNSKVSDSVESADQNFDPPGHDPFEGCEATVEMCLTECQRLSNAYNSMAEDDNEAAVG